MKKYLGVSVILALVLVLVAGCAPTSSESPTIPLSSISQEQPLDEGTNFRLLISDDVNAIEDFSELYIDVSGIGMHQGGEGESGTWFTEEFEEGDIEPIDIKPLQGSNAVILWDGWLPEGEYNKIFIYVRDAWGTLNEGVEPPTKNPGDDWKVKLPGGKLQISKNFEVDEGGTADFVFDVTVVRAGKSGKFILKPQIAESGTDQKITLLEEVKDVDEEETDDEIEFEGIITQLEPELIIGDYTVLIDEDTDIEGELAVDLNAKVEGILQGDVSMLALKIEVEES